MKEFEDTKQIIRIRKSKKDRQHNDQTKKYKGTNNDLQNITQKIKDRATRTPLTETGEIGTTNITRYKFVNDLRQVRGFIHHITEYR